MSRYAPVALIALCAALEIALHVQKSALDDARRQAQDVKSRVDRLGATQRESVGRKAGGDQPAVQKVFGKLFTEKVPGTDTPYVTAVGRVQEKANQGLKQTMGPDAFGKYQGMNLKPENIETGFDPWIDYLQQKGK